MTQIKKHSPLKKGPLRNPGQSLDEKMQDVLYDDVYFYIIISAFLVLIAMAEWGRQIFDTPPAPLLWTFIAVISVGVSVMKGMEALRKIKNIKLGRDGERQVGHFLEEQFYVRGYKVFHDIQNDKGNVDHVLVGPGGIFTIETKTRSKNSSYERISSDGKNIFVGDSVDIKALNQAAAEAIWLRGLVLVGAGLDRAVQPIVVFPGWFVSIRTDMDVWLMHEDYLVKKIESRGVVLNEMEIIKITDVIEKHMRDFEKKLRN